LSCLNRRLLRYGPTGRRPAAPATNRASIDDRCAVPTPAVPFLRPLTRRRLLTSVAATVAVVALPVRTSSEENAADGYRVLHARTGTALLRGKDTGPTPIWGYDGMSPGPILRVNQGEELKVRLVNDLKQSTRRKLTAT
jgi:hypothetical protein